jgi:2-haloalkanoic acid dehalogenase type II
MSTPTFTHFTFDCYGTLIDWRRGIEEGLGGLLRRKGLSQRVKIFPVYMKLEASEEGRYKSYRSILKDTAVRVGRQFSIEVTATEAADFANSVAHWTPFEDSVQTLRELGKRDRVRVILSNVDKDILRETIAKNSLLVDGYITAEDVGSYKPGFGHWLKFLESYRVPKEKTLHVAGSVYHDIVPAKELGFKTAWINRYAEANEARADPDFVLRDLRSLLELPI